MGIIRSIKGFFSKIVNFFSKDTGSTPVVTPPKEVVNPQFPIPPEKPQETKPAPLPEVPKADPIPSPAPEVQKPEKPIEDDIEAIYLEWTKRALDISQRFEGTIPWANPTGNFDGMGLTMGALGLTIYYGDQQPLVKDFVRMYGLEEMFKLMPKCGQSYWNVCQAKPSVGVGMASAWSQGSRVFEPYRSELVKFWQDPRMMELQVAQARKVMGEFAIQQGKAFCNASKLGELNFHVFSFYFDWGVLNGASLKGVTYETTNEFYKGNWDKALKEVIEYGKTVSSASVYNAKSMQLCSKHWAGLTQIATYKKMLMAIGYRRAQLSKPKFVADVICRRGTIALGSGYVHEDFYDLNEKIK